MNKTILLLTVFLAFCSLFGAEVDFYVWQRQPSKELEQAVSEFYRTCPGKLYFLAGEIENDGRSIPVSPSKKVDFSRAVPVVRIHVRNLEKTPAVLAGEIIRFYDPWKKTGALQIDLDAPESRLKYYRDLMCELKKLLPETELSATVLPCHLRHGPAVRELAAECDFFVLQVHGLACRNKAWSIYDHAEAVRALMRAKALNLPFKTALPLYCSWMERGRLVKPGLTDVSKLAAVCGDVIGFRLGVPGDGTALDLASALRICRGKGYAPKLEFRWERKARGPWKLFVRNNGFFAEPVTLKLEFEVPPEDMDTFNQAVLNAKGDELTLILPPSRMEKTYLWVRPGGDPDRKPEVKIERKGDMPK